MTVPLKLQAGRMQLVSKRPYLASAVYAVAIVESKRVPTMAVDRYWRLYYNPEYLEQLPAEEVVGVLYHEISHLLRDHTGRGDALSLSKETVAAWLLSVDLEINPHIVKEQFVLPEGVAYPKQFMLPEGLLAEEYFEILKGLVGGGEGAAGSGGGGGGGNDGRSLEDILNDAPIGRCGSGAKGGELEEWEEEGDDKGRKVGKVEGDLIRRNVAEEVRQYASRNPGNVPGWMERWAERILNPQIPWQKVLASYVRSAVRYTGGMLDYTYRKFPRRRLPGIVTPAMHRPIPNVSIIIDTSGSMSSRELEAALAEVKGVLKSLGLVEGVEVLCVDHAIGSSQKVQRASDVKLVGGGGTNMGIGIVEAEKNKADVIIVLTDGETPWPKTPPKRGKVVVGIVREDGQMPSYSEPPRWAKTVMISAGRR